MSRKGHSFVCQNCGAAYTRWQGKCESCGEWNTLAEEAAEAPLGKAGPGKAAGTRPRLLAATAFRRDPGRPSPCHRHERIRPRHRRRAGARLGAAARRRSRHRQVHAAGAGRGRARASSSSARSISPAKKRWRRCGCARSGCRSAGDKVELAAETSVEDIIATLSQGDLPRLVVIDFDPDHVDRHGRIRARHGDAGARLGAGADPLCQEERRLRDPGRPRHERRPDRRSARGRAHGRCGDVVRGRRLASIPHPARGEKPLRPDRRDRRVRDDGAGPAGGA